MNWLLNAMSNQELLEEFLALRQEIRQFPSKADEHIELMQDIREILFRRGWRDPILTGD